MSQEARPDTVVVVGGAGGIGSAIVRRFHADGARVAICDEDTAPGRELVSELGDDTRFFNVNVLDPDSIEAFAAELMQEYGAIDHLISLAGGSLDREHEGLKVLTLEMINDSIDLNLKSHLFLIRALVPLLSAGAGGNRSITFISSINAVKDYGLPAYSAAKAGLLGLTHPLATELGPRGIRVNTLLPGTVLTERTAHLPRRLEDSRKNGTALNRFATAAEIADVAWSIARTMTCVTGQRIVADCGQSMRGYPLFSATTSPEG